MKYESERGTRGWRERLIAANLILPILELELICEAFRAAGARGLALLSRRARRPRGETTRGAERPQAGANMTVIYPETWGALREGIILGLMMTIQAAALIIGLASAVGFILYLASVPWLCLREARRPARFRRRPVSPVPRPPDPDAYDLLVTLSCLEADAGGNAGRQGPSPKDRAGLAR
jgi:hypothetical protein